jgi:hypothetical protein
LIIRSGTRAIVDLLLIAILDTGTYANFTATDVYYIPIVGTGLNARQEWHIWCYKTCGATQITLPAAISPNGTASAAGCSFSASWSQGYIGDGYSMDECLTQAVISAFIFAAFYMATVGGAPTAGLTVAIGMVLAAGAGYMDLLDKIGGAER